MRQDREEVAEGGAVGDQAAVAGDEPVHALVAALRRLGLRDRAEALVVGERVDDRGDERGLAAEVVPHGVAVGAGLGRDGLDRERLVAAARQQTPRGRHQLARRRRELGGRIVCEIPVTGHVPLARHPTIPTPPPDRHLDPLRPDGDGGRLGHSSVVRPNSTANQGIMQSTFIRTGGTNAGCSEARRIARIAEGARSHGEIRAHARRSSRKS